MSKAVNLAEMFFRCVDANPDRVAIACDSGAATRTITYRALAGQVAGATAALRSNDVASETCVAYSINDPVVDLVHFIALTSLGVGICQVTSGSGAERGVLARLGASRLLADHDGFEDLGLPRVDAEGRYPCCAAAGSVSAPIEDCAGKPWMFGSSSGTTGHPKIFVTTHADAVSRRERYFSAVGSGREGFYSLTPLRFLAARQRYFHEISRGVTAYLLPDSGSLKDKVEGINRHAIARVYCVPMYLELLCDQAERAGASRTRSCLLPHRPFLEVNSSPVAPAILDKAQRWVSPNIVNCYSTSEVGHISSTLGLERRNTGGSDIGRAVAGVELAVLGEGGVPVAQGEAGRLAVRFIHQDCSVRYLDQSGAWVSPMVDGWFIPGDVGTISPERRVSFLGRADDLIIFNGINIFPEEIERVARSVPGVQDACAFGVPARVHYQVPWVAVIAGPGFDQREFAQQMRRQLGPRAPVKFAVVAGFPRNAMGKVVRRQLAAMAVAGPRRDTAPTRG
jgi:acyl-coenzyme A synthetase/AMP-(fatty) acid ligase